MVLEADAALLRESYANVHRGMHALSDITSEAYERARGTVARFLGAASPEEIVFTSGATEAINLVAASWAGPRLAAGDEVILSVMEHHANIVPWHFLRERQGVTLTWVEPDQSGHLDPEKLLARIGPRTRMIAVTEMSNVLGAKVDVARIARGAQAAGVPVLVDGSQAAVHRPVDVAAIGADFYVITGHKLYAQPGSGALWARPERLAEMRPFHGGGGMIAEVTRDAVRYAAAPARFEAGTPSFVSAIGLGAALDWLMAIGMERIAAYEAGLAATAAAALGSLPWLRLQGGGGPILSFTVDGAHPTDVAMLLDQQGIAVRAGHHCAQPL